MRKRTRLLAVLAVPGVCATVVLGCATSSDPCGDFRFSTERWRAALASVEREETNEDYEPVTTKAETLARRVVECGVVERGETKDAVRRRLGAPSPRETTRRDFYWDVGWVNDALGPGDAGALWVQFDAGGRVIDLEAPGAD